MYKNSVLKLLISIISTILFCYCSNDVPYGMNEVKNYHQDFLKIWTDFDTSYSCFNLKKIDWNAIKEKYEPLVKEKMTYDDFIYNVIQKMLNELQDLSVFLITLNGDLIWPSEYTYKPNYKYDKYFFDYFPGGIQGTSPNGNILYGTISDSIGYILVDHWSNNSEIAKFDSILMSFEQHKGMIFDLRSNQGGDKNVVYWAAEKFTAVETKFASYQFRNGTNHSDFSEMVDIYIEPAGDKQFTKPVILLIGEKCVQASEFFILMMDALPNVITVGDSTYGNYAGTLRYTLGDGTFYFIPNTILYNLENAPLEDHGVAPDIYIPPSTSYNDKHDYVLEKAIEMLKAGI